MKSPHRRVVARCCTGRAPVEADSPPPIAGSAGLYRKVSTSRSGLILTPSFLGRHACHGVQGFVFAALPMLEITSPTR